MVSVTGGKIRPLLCSFLKKFNSSYLQTDGESPGQHDLALCKVRSSDTALHTQRGTQESRNSLLAGRVCVCVW